MQLIRAALTPAGPVAATTARAPLWIKICGLRTREAIDAAVESEASAIGFVFHAASPRNLDPAAAAELSRAVPAGIDRVAVFLHPSQSLVNQVLETVTPDWVQMDAEDLAGLALPVGQRVLPVLRTGGQRFASGLSATDARETAQLPARCLLESARSGSGERADWSEAARLARATELVLAGGLDPGNVADAVRAVRPFGVDVSSGIERERGVKDVARIREFVRAAREAARALPFEESPK
jgi:phosphoribosylanthranilate isomerase